jgi:hypothetical protein
MGTDRVFESPDVFQRFVCQQVASAFGPSTGEAGAISTMLPPEFVMPVDGTMSSGMQPGTPSGLQPEMQLPPSPPAALETEQ